MSAALTPDDRRAITTCPDCTRPWMRHGDADGICKRTDETIAQVEALVRAKQAEARKDALVEAADWSAHVASEFDHDGLGCETDGADRVTLILRGLIPEDAP